MMPVAHLKYIVEQDRKDWTIKFGGTPRGCFESRRQALESAVRDAKRVRGMGHEVDVLVRRPDGTLRQIPERISTPMMM